MDYQALKAELDSGHPVTGAYNADNALAAAEMNALNVSVQRETISSSIIFESIAETDFDTLTTAQKEKLQLILGLGDEVQVGPTSRTRAMLLAMFGAGTDTRANLVAAVTETISRSSQLGFTAIDQYKIEYARTL